MNKYLFFSFSLLIILNGCHKEHNKKTVECSVETTSPTRITQRSAYSGGIVTCENIIEKGICWANHANPTTSDNTDPKGGGEGTFECEMKGLSPEQTYYIRAYAITNDETIYGTTVGLSTLPVPIQPTLNSPILYKLAHTSVSIEERGILNAGNMDIQSSGVCWDTSPNPTIKSYNTKDELAHFPQNYHNITGLSPGTLYYARAWATTAAGDVYSPQITVNTYMSVLTDIDGNTYNTVKIAGDEWMADNLTVKHFSNGDVIPINTGWPLQTTAMCFYNSSGPSKYGALYNWYAVTDQRKLAPPGWHVATKEEWQRLFASVDNSFDKGHKFRITDQPYWTSTITGPATNETGFSAVGSGYRNVSSNGQQTVCYFWLNRDPTNPTSSLEAALINNASVGFTPIIDLSAGFSVRCVKD